MSKYYVVATEYVGPNASQHVDDNTIEIYNTPAVGNMHHQPIITGWCGTTDDWAVFAHGEYDSEAAARAYIEQEWPKCREQEKDPLVEDDAVASFKPGEYEQWSQEQVADWIYEAIEESISASTTDAEIDAMVQKWERIANQERATLGDYAEDLAINHRDDLQAEEESTLD